MASTSVTGTLGHQDSDDVAVPCSKMHMRHLEAMELKGKSLAVDNQNPVTTFSLHAQQQHQSLLLALVPGEVRQMIYKFCGIGPGKIHFYEQTPKQGKAVLPCPPGCSCRPLGLLALILTCQTFHTETLDFLYHSNTFIIYKGVFSTVLNADVAIQQYTLSTPLRRIRHLQLDLGHAKVGSTLAIQSKHATLRAVLEVAVNLRGLSVVFNTQFDRMSASPLDNVTIRLLSRFRGLANFQLVIQNAQDCYENMENEHIWPGELEFIRAVPDIEAIYAKFVKLRHMADATGLDEEEKRMVKSEARFEKGLKEKVRRMLAGGHRCPRKLAAEEGSTRSGRR